MSPTGFRVCKSRSKQGSRRVVCGVVRLRRQALPRPDGSHDLALEVRWYRLKARVLRGPEGAALGRGSDRGREAEHLRDGRLRVDHRELALLADVVDHAAAALDRADGGAHEVLRDVDEDLLDRLQQDAAREDHRPIDGGPGGGDHLGGTAVDGVLVELRVDESDLERHPLLGGEGTAVHRLDVCLLDQLHRLVQVLDALRRIDQHVRVVDPDDVLRLVAVHAEFLQLFREDLRVLDPLAGRDLARADRLDDFVLEGLDLHVEPVVLVRRLPFEGAAFPRDALPVHDDRRAGRNGDLVVVLDPIDRDLEVQFAHAGDQVLSRLLIDLDLDARIRLGDQAEGLDELRQVRRRLGLDRDRYNGVGVVDDLLERLHVLVVAHGRASDRVLQADDRDHVPGIDLVHRDAVRADDHRHRLRALGFRHPHDPQFRAAADLAGEQAARGDLARLRVHDDLRDHVPNGAVLVHLHHRLPDGRAEVPLPDDRDAHLLRLERIRQVADHHVQDDAMEGRLLRELLHRPLLAVLVDVLERDPGFLHERDGQGPLVERAAEGDAARFHVDHPFLAYVLREPLADAVVHLRDDLREALLHLLGRDFQLVHKAVDLVDEQGRPHAFLQRLPDDRLRLRHDAFDRIDEDDDAVDRAHRAGDVPAEVHVTGCVDQVDQVLPALEVVDHGRDGRVDRDAPGLFLLVVVHKELRARELFGDHPRARDEGVGEGRVMDEQAFGHEVLWAGYREVGDPCCSGVSNVPSLDRGHIFMHQVLDGCNIRTGHQAPRSM